MFVLVLPNLTQARVIREERTSMEKMPAPDCPCARLCVGGEWGDVFLISDGHDVRGPSPWGQHHSLSGGLGVYTKANRAGHGEQATTSASVPASMGLLCAPALMSLTVK